MDVSAHETANFRRVMIVDRGQTHGDERGQALPGLMMDFPLTVRHVLRRMASVHGSKRVTTLVDPETGECTERSFREVVARAGQLANALARLGVRPGDRVASLAWNNAEHIEIYLAVMCMGAVLHTMNLRLHGDQLAYTVNHAEDTVVIVQDCLSAQLAAIMPDLTTVKTVIVIDEGAERATELLGALDYEALLVRESSDFRWPDFDERSAASLCYTSGTTGDPKGVLYSHRSIVLHALSMSGADVYGLNIHDRVLLLVPLFHAMGWGLPFVCGLVGADFIMPGRHVRPAPLARLIEEQKVTWSCGVPTLWLDLLHHLDDGTEEREVGHLSSLNTVLCGGTAVPDNLITEYEERFGVAVIRGWGMTEIFPGATIGRDDPHDSAAQKRERRRTAGRVSPMYELRVTGEAGIALPNDGVAVGNIEVRGPVVTGGYFRNPDASAAAICDGWLRTGDVGTLDDAGTLRITDRAKDVIKSGGEWISSQDLESEIMAHPAVREAAVIGVPDERWGERPVAFVVTRALVAQGDLQQFLHARVARWWVPERFVFVADIARTSTGKYDKKALAQSVSE
jgi:fatty-acyl-CoA synthase